MNLFRYQYVIFQAIAHASLLLLPWVVNSVWDAVLIVVMYVLCCGFGISAMYHRWAAHVTWEPGPVVERVGLWFGALAGVGPAKGFASMHREHHRWTDVPGMDPHTPEKTTFLHMYTKPLNAYWIRMPDSGEIALEYWCIHGLWAGFLASIDLSLLVTAWLAPAALTWIAFGYGVNWCCHRGVGIGLKLFEGNSTDNAVISWLVFGEGNHFTHHAGFRGTPTPYLDIVQWAIDRYTQWQENRCKNHKNPL